MQFWPKIEKIIKKNKKMSSPHNFVDFDDENHNIWNTTEDGPVLLNMGLCDLLV